jgi:zinc transport system ATP-binding protein
MVPSPFVPHAYTSAEEQSNAFSQMTGLLTPQLLRGGNAFLAAFGKWALSYVDGSSYSDKLCVRLPPNPLHGIVFPTASECLENAAKLVTGSNGDLVKELSDRFALTDDLLHRPAQTLSGGERALVALAKCAAMLPIADEAVICSPSRWLHPSRRTLISSALRGCRSSAGKAAFLHLEGELQLSSEAVFKSLDASNSTVSWSLMLDSPTVVFSKIEFPYPAPAKRLVYRDAGLQRSFSSPTLITGDNGVGKSTLGKMLARLISVQLGSFEARAHGFSASPRFLFQDTTQQLFTLRPVDHMRRAFQFSASLDEAVAEEFQELEALTAEVCAINSDSQFVGNAASPNSLLQARLVLVAERLVARSRLLIMDEPSWGLSALAAHAFLSAVASRCAHHKVALLVITHEADALKQFFRSHISLDPGERADEVLLRSMEP